MSTNQKPKQEQDDPTWEDEDDNEFIPCSDCDGHPACEDFGCAIKAGLSNLVQRDITDL